MPQPPNRNVSQADALIWAIEAEECRRSLKVFLKSVWHIFEPKKFVDGWVIDCLCDHLEAVYRGDIRSLLINIPPRHSKSSIVSVVWPLWTWLQNPSEQILCASFNLNLAIRDNTRKRNIIEDTWFHERFPFIQLSEEQNLKQYFTNTQNGHQQITSVGGSTTGLGGSILICDDPHNVDEAHSDVERQSAVTWFRESWSNRMNTPSQDKMVVVGQRIHEDDVSGYILRDRPDWTSLILPAYYEPARHCATSIGWEDPRKQDGELLWLGRFSQGDLAGLQRALGGTGFASQYQQLPVPSGGAIFQEEWFRYFKETLDAYVLETPYGAQHVLKSSCWTFGTTDLAISSKQQADYTVFAVWAVTPANDLLLLHVTRDRFSNAEQVEQLHRLHMRFGVDFWKVETVAYQLAFFQQALSLGIPCKEYRPVKDKVSRAATASRWCENGKTYWRDGAEWLMDWESEHVRFPKGRHDDMVDVHSQAAEEICQPASPYAFASSSTTPSNLPPTYEPEEGEMDEQQRVNMLRRQQNVGKVLQTLGRIRR